MLKFETFPKLFKIAGIILVGGLVAEVITLFWFNPLSFLFHMSIAGLLITIGVLIYLYVVVRS